MFGGLDYGVLAAYFALTAGVGWWAGRGQTDAGGFWKGGGRMPTWAVCLSILASETSALTFCSVPGQAYRGDYTYLQFVAGNLVGRLLVAFLFIPAFYSAGVTSVYEYLGLRFGPATRGAASALFVLTRILASGLRLTVAAIIVNAALPQWSFARCVLAFTVITVVYSVYGGIRSIIWTDVLQFFLFVGGGALALAVILGDVGAGGALEAIRGEAARGVDKLRVIDPSLDLGRSYTLLTAAVCGPVLMFATHGTDQDMVQRMLTCRESREGSRSVVMSGIVSLPMVALFLAIGTGLFAFYARHPDLAAGLPQGPPDRIFPHFIVHQLPAGLRGLVIAGVFAAAMSTTSSAIGALALVAVVDGLRRIRPRKGGAGSDLGVSRIMTAVMGAVLGVVALGFHEVRQSLLDVGLEVMTYAYGSMLGVFCLGRFTRARGSDRGNVLALGAGVAAVLGVKFGINHDRIVVAWPWFTLVGFGVTFGIGSLFPGPATSSACRGASGLPRSGPEPSCPASDRAPGSV